MDEQNESDNPTRRAADRQMLALIDLVRESHRVQLDRIAKIEAKLIGNGEPGLVWEVREAKQQVKELRKDVDQLGDKVHGISKEAGVIQAASINAGGNVAAASKAMWAAICTALLGLAGVIVTLFLGR